MIPCEPPSLLHRSYEMMIRSQKVTFWANDRAIGRGGRCLESTGELVVFLHRRHRRLASAHARMSFHTEMLSFPLNYATASARAHTHTTRLCCYGPSDHFRQKPVAPTVRGRTGQLICKLVSARRERIPLLDLRTRQLSSHCVWRKARRWCGVVSLMINRHAVFSLPLLLLLLLFRLFL